MSTFLNFYFIKINNHTQIFFIQNINRLHMLGGYKINDTQREHTHRETITQKQFGGMNISICLNIKAIIKTKRSLRQQNKRHCSNIEFHNKPTKRNFSVVTQ